jgi:outer membrane protein OmpA-like peptidoglycan-associated protein
MKSLRILLIAALVALTTFSHAQTSFEINAGTALLYADAPTTHLSEHIGVRLNRDFRITPNIEGGIFLGAFGRRLHSGSFSRNEGRGEIGTRIAVGNRFQLFGELALSGAAREVATANLNGAMGAQWKTTNGTKFGARIAAERNVVNPDALDGVIQGNNDVVVTPSIFVRVPLFKKRKQREMPVGNHYDTIPPAVYEPVPVKDIAATRDALMRDSVFGKGLEQFVVQIASAIVIPMRDQLMRNDSFVLDQIQKVERRVEKAQQETLELPSAKTKAKMATIPFTWHFQAGETEPSKAQIANLQRWLDDVSNQIGKPVRIEITGSTSRSGTEAKNLEIANKRVDCAKAALGTRFKPEQILTRIRTGNSNNVADQFVQLLLVY